MGGELRGLRQPRHVRQRRRLLLDAQRADHGGGHALLAGLAAISQTDSNFEDEKLTNETTMPDTSLALLSPDETKKTSKSQLRDDILTRL